MTKLSDIGEFKNGLNFSKADAGNGCKMIGVSNFGTRLVPNYSDLSEVHVSVIKKDDLLEDGDILFVRSNGNKALVGRTLLIEQPPQNITFSGFCIRFRPRKDKVISRYLIYLLKSPAYRKKFSVTQQTNINNLNQNILGGLSLSLPKIDKQQLISNTLFILDEKITLNNRTIAELEAMAHTIYDYWFVQFDFPNAEGKPYRQSGGEMEYNETLKREIPKGWRVELIGNLLDKVPNTTKTITTDYLPFGKVPVIDQSTDFIAGYVNDYTTKLSIDGGGIVFGDHTRIVKYIGFDFARGADGTQVLISNNKNEMPQLLLFQVVKSIDLSNYGYARHFKFLKEQPCVVPNDNIAQSFNEAVESIYKDITHRILGNLELTRLRDWLLPMLMNGQATVE